MLLSMTGYGRGEHSINNMKAVVEVRSVNHRYLDISLRMSRSLYGLEQHIRRDVANSVARGKIEVSIQVDFTGEHTADVRLNTRQAAQIADLLRELQQAAGCAGNLDTASLLAFKDLLFEQHESENDPESSQKVVGPALNAALQAMQTMQAAEGAQTARDMQARITTVRECVAAIERAAPHLLSQRQQSLREKIQTLCDGIALDEGRINQEIAMLADKSDITEELVRLKSHIIQFRQWLDAEGPIGRKLDFLMQEMNREINTVGSKISDSDIALKVVEVKNELEKIREQIQNIM